MPVEVAVAVSDEMKLSLPNQIICCWSGWRISSSSNRAFAWYTAHLPAPMIHPNMEGDRYAQSNGCWHVVSVVQSSHNERPQGNVSGYWLGEEFNTSGSIYLEENSEVLASFNCPDFIETMDRVFADRKQAAIDALVKYIKEMSPLCLPR